MCWTCEGPHMKKESPKKSKTSTSKCTSSSIDQEHYGVEGHAIDHCYSLHPKLCFNKYINNNYGKSKRGCGGNEGKATSKASSKANDQGRGDMAIT